MTKSNSQRTRADKVKMASEQASQEGLRVATQGDHLTSKYVGTGHPNTTRFEWACNVKRDTSALVVANHSMASYQAIGMNQSIGRVKYQMKQDMLMPCGVAPAQEEGLDATGMNGNGPA